jgi:hypothetical protein
MSGQVLRLKARGLFTHPNPLSEVPDGAMSEAKNVVIDKEGIVESRRGFARYGSVLADAPKQLFGYQDKVFVHHGTTLDYDSDGAGTLAAVSASISEPEAGLKLRALEANKNLYLATATGVMKLDAYNGTLRDAGVPGGLDGTAALAGAGSAMSTACQVAYRVVWGLKDANNNLVLGAPSQRITVSNSSGSTQDVTVTFTIPTGVTTSHIYQVYRSGNSASASDDANDELQLVYESSPTAGEITAKSVSVTDRTPESLRGATLYASPSQEGIANANDLPPYCKDFCVYRGSVFYANTTSRHSIEVNLLSAYNGASGDGLRVNDTVTIAGVVYTGKAAESVAANEFLCDNVSVSASDRIENTALSLVKVINQSASNSTVYAYYTSGYQDLPGQIVIRNRSFSGASFTVASSRSGVWDPDLGTAQASSNDQTPGRIYISKTQQPEAVPLYSYVDVGSARDPIKRIVALRDSVFVFKNEGIYRITGEDLASFRVALFDNTARIKAPETVVALNNQALAFTDQGVVAVSDSGVAVLSRPIEATLLSLSSSNYSSFASISWAVGYESERKYLLFVPTLTGDSYATQAYVYNTFTQSWTRWDMDRSCGYVNPADGKLYLGDPSNSYVYQERKALDRNDYADEEFDVTITGVSGTTVSVSSTTNALAGRTLGQGQRRAVITAVGTGTVTVAQALPFTNGAAKIYVPIDCDITFTENDAGNPGILKQFPEATLFFNDANFSSVTLYFTSNFSNNSESFTVSPVVSSTAWGGFEWGNEAWDAGAGTAQAIRTYLPLEKQRAIWIKPRVRLTQAFNSFAFTGMSLQVNGMSSRFR